MMTIDQGLSKEQVEIFERDGVLVMHDFLSKEQIEKAKEGLSSTLLSHGVDTEHLEETGINLQRLSSTNGSGGVLDLFYDHWKMEIATDPRLFRMTSQLWDTYCHQGEEIEHLQTDDRFRWHPYGKFDTTKGYAYIDRVGFRIPTKLSEKLGAKLELGDVKHNRKKKALLQRSLTPHLDCCPETFYQIKRKWRPIQCFVSLTDNILPNTGGFEVAKCFHREFEQWASHRQPSIFTRNRNGMSEIVTLPAPCIGEYTHIRPNEDQAIMKRVQHVPVRAGSVVFFDNRLPHANAYRHDGERPRSVVYCSFLPDVAVNRDYVSQQLSNWQKGLNPNDQWIEEKQNPKESLELIHETLHRLSPFGRELLGIKD